MKTVAVVAWREIVEHRMFVAAAGAALLLILVVPLASDLFKASPVDVREALMVCMALGFIPLSAVILGASTVSGAMAAGRFGFFLSRPLSATAVWTGKLTGVLAVVLVCEAIILAPAVVAGNPNGAVDAAVERVTGVVEESVYDLYGWWWDAPLSREGMLLILAVVLPVTLVLLAHAVATLWRGRTLWLILNVLTLVAGSAIAWLCVRPLVENGATAATAVVAIAMAAAALVALACVPLVQVAVSGVDPRRHHRVFSVTIAAAVVVLFGGVAAYVAWLTAPHASDLLRGTMLWPTGEQDLEIQGSADGRWIAVSGHPAGRLDYKARFLIDLGSSTAVRINPMRSGSELEFSGVAFSGDGSRAAWLNEIGELYVQIRYADLDEATGGWHDTTIVMGGSAHLALSVDGNHVATIDDRTLSVSTFPGGHLVGSVPLPGYYWRAPIWFGPGDIVRVIGQGFRSTPERDALFVTEYHLTTREIRRSVLREADSAWDVAFDTQRHRILFRTQSDRTARWRYVDAESLEDIAWTEARPLGSEVAMLSGERLADLIDDGRNRRLEVLTPDGELVGNFALPPAVRVGQWYPWAQPTLDIGAQPDPEGLLIQVGQPSPAATLYDRWGNWDHHLIVLDLTAGTTQELDHGLDQVLGSRPPAGSPASRLLRDREGRLLLWDPETGAMEDLAARYE